MEIRSFLTFFVLLFFHGSVWLIGFSGIPFLFQGPQYNIDRLLNLKQFCMPLGRNSVWCTFAYFVGIPWRNHTNCSWVQLVCHSISHLPVVVASSYKSHQISDCKSLLFHSNTTTSWIGPVHLNCACLMHSNIEILVENINGNTKLFLWIYGAILKKDKKQNLFWLSCWPHNSV